MTRIFLASSVAILAAACSSGSPVNQQVSVDPESGAIIETVDENTTVAQSSTKSAGQVCRHERQVGSRIGKRICRTKGEEQSHMESAQSALEQNQINSDREHYGKEY